MTEDPIEQSLNRADAERAQTPRDKALLWVVVIGLALVFAVTMGYILVKAKLVGH